MRVLLLLAGMMVLGASPAIGDDQDKLEIKRLQERLDLLEAKLAILLAAQDPVPRIENVEAPPTLQQPQPKREVTPPELLPELGKIGAEVGLVLSGASNPFHLNNGQDAAGFIDLPLFEPRALHGKVGYEILIGLSQSKTNFATTSLVTQASQPTETNLKLLQIVPLSFKYTSTALDRFRLRPYALLGFGMFITIHKEVTPDGVTLVAGQVPQSPELAARGLPLGAGNIDFGIHSGAGFEFRLNRSFSLGFDGSFNRISGGQTLGTYGTRLGFHF